MTMATEKIIQILCADRFGKEYTGYRHDWCLPFQKSTNKRDSFLCVFLLDSVPFSLYISLPPSPFSAVALPCCQHK
jgi:hypothetical protein